ncbi:MAG: hypothetical protein WCV84_00735 [Patescibacteria group bacterium]
MNYARVIPLLRTPLGVDVFDYAIPESLIITPNMLVVAPFRRQSVVGLVRDISSQSAHAARALPLKSTYCDLALPPTLVQLLDWTAARTFSSRPTVLKAWLRALPKRFPVPVAGRPSSPPAKLSIITHWIARSEQALLVRAQEALRDHQRTLIVTPWRDRADRLSGMLACSVLHGELNDGDAFRAWRAFLVGETQALVTTRLGAWLATGADVVLLDEPENDDHKQDELAPRYDARLMLAWCAQHGGIALETFGLTPPLHIEAEAPAINVPFATHIRHPQGRSAVPMMQADSMLAIQEHEGPVTIIHPIRGVRARLRCRDCGWEATCVTCHAPLSAETTEAICRSCGKRSDLPLACGSCQGLDLGKSMPGIETLKKAWQRAEPSRMIDWRDTTAEQMDVPFANGSLVLVTDASLLAAGEDIRRRERLCLAFRRLADRVEQAHGALIIQADELAAGQYTEWLTTKGMQEFRERERAERRVFRYPPSTRLVKVIVAGDAQKANQWMARLQSALQTRGECRGPFPVPQRSSTRHERHIIHLLFPPRTEDRDLVAWLTPFAKDSIIDLDPIAFFR